KLTATQVRGLMGSVSSDVLVQAMQCVHRNAPDDLLKLLDRLMTEGQSPAHFTKQLVRFLRNAVVAKIAGGDSPLLQISSDEKKKVAGVAELFSEEDLTRFLNVILRTHDELGYRQEQRFHLELGMLKMVHAHRLLPLEELLSQTAASGAGASGSSLRAPVSSASAARPLEQPQRSALNSLRPSSSPFGSAPGSSSAPSRPASPFEADRLRKARSSEPEMSAAGKSSILGSSEALRPEVARGSISGESAAVAVAEAPEETVSEIAPEPVSLERLRSALVSVLEAQGQDTAADLLARGEWKLEGNQLNLRLPLSEKVIDLSLSADSRRLLAQEASRVCGRVMKLNVSGGGTSQDAPVERANGNGHVN